MKHRYVATASTSDSRFHSYVVAGVVAGDGVDDDFGAEEHDVADADVAYFEIADDGSQNDVLVPHIPSLSPGGNDQTALFEVDRDTGHVDEDCKPDVHAHDPASLVHTQADHPDLVPWIQSSADPSSSPGCLDC